MSLQMRTALRRHIDKAGPPFNWVGKKRSKCHWLAFFFCHATMLPGGGKDLDERRWTIERSISWLQNFRRLCVRWTRSTCQFQCLLRLNCSLLLLETAFE